VGVLALWLVVALLLSVTIFMYGRVDQAQTADVIVVLGAGLQPDDRPGPALIRRTAQAVALWQRGIADHVICAGGFGLNRTRSEADACAQLLIDQEVPPEVIILEERSRSTEENALYTHDIMQANDWQTVVLVSDGYHLLRAHWIFERAGIVNWPSPALDPPFFNHFSSTLREIVAFHWLAFKTVFNLPVAYVPVI
jgi:uncharacterized SAM-binding protein YcdF (DUF218 family)